MERKIGDWVGCISAFILVIFVNYLSNALPLNGFTQKDLSDKYVSLFTPAGFTFSIWGLIYLALAGFVVYQALPAQRFSKLTSRISTLFIFSCLANIAWLFAWHYEFVGLSLFIMFCILAILIVIYRTLGTNKKQVGWKEYLFLYLPFSLYIGWITVATVANISVWQNAMGWDNQFINAESWTLLKLAVVAAICAIVVLRLGDFVYALVIGWAAFGIMSKQADTPEVAGAATMLVTFSVVLATYQMIATLLKEPNQSKGRL